MHSSARYSATGSTELAAAHLVGVSFGWSAVNLAVRRPELVASLTALHGEVGSGLDRAS